MLRHGRIVALFVALKECPHILLNDYADKIISTLISYISADRVSDRKECVCVCVSTTVIEFASGKLYHCSGNIYFSV